MPLMHDRFRTRALPGAAILLAALMLSLVGTPVQAEPDGIQAAKAKAKKLAAQVSELEEQVEMAGEQLAGAQDELGRLVSQELTAKNTLADLSTAAQRSRAATNERVRALYMSGGQTGLYATVLDGGSLVDVLARMDSVDRVLDRDRGSAEVDADAVADAARLQLELTALSERQTELEATARIAEDEIQSLLAAHQSALDDAGATVRKLTEEWRAAQARAAAERAAVQLGASGPLPTQLPSEATAAGVALRAADSVRGVPYVYAANGPDSFDCSGLTRWAYALAGVGLPRTSRQQWTVGPHPALADLQPGDLLFWANNVNDPTTIHHVALYVGAGWMIHAPHTGDVVRYARVYLDGYIGATRPTT